MPVRGSWRRRVRRVLAIGLFVPGLAGCASDGAGLDAFLAREEGGTSSAFDVARAPLRDVAFLQPPAPAAASPIIPPVPVVEPVVAAPAPEPIETMTPSAAQSPPAPAAPQPQAFVGALAATGFVARLETSAGATSAIVRNDMRPRAVTISAQAPDAEGAQTITAASAGLLATLRVSGRMSVDQAGGYLAEGVSASAQVRVSSTLAASLGATSLAHAYVGETFAQSASTTSAAAQRIDEASGFFGGRATRDMPTSGAGAYVGAFQGRETVWSPGVEAASARLQGDMTLDADFAAASVRGRIDNVRARADGAQDWAARPYGVSVAGKIDGAAVSAASVLLVEPNTGTALPKVAQWGSAVGGFFGPGGAEIAGALTLSAKDGQERRVLTGVFGLKRN